MLQPSFCAACGSPFRSEDKAEPHPHCARCGTTNWQNPRPVAVLLQPVRDEETGKLGLVICQRAIEPFIGDIALPAGFVEMGETIEAAAARELEEEVRLYTPASYIRMLESRPAGNITLVFCTTEHVLPNFTHEPFAPTDEASTRGVIWSPTKLCFPLHTDIVEEWFKGRA
jgi:8-oxo-dGTP diphosphatase